MTPESRSETLYLRVTPEVREAAERFGADRGLRLSSAVAELVDLGLKAVVDEGSIKMIEAKLRDAIGKLGEARLDLERRQGMINALQERDQKWAGLFATVEGNLRATGAGRCGCGYPLNMFDALIERRCPNPECRRALDQVVQSSDGSNPALAALAGAIGGLVLGLAAGQSAKP